MAKAPVPGAVKTRLVPPLTEAQAAELSRALLVDLLGQARELGSAAAYLYYTPSEVESLMRRLAGDGFDLRVQCGADLGERMQNIFSELWAAGHRKVVLIGGDIPALPIAYLVQAFEWLEVQERRVVLGPSQDGGYYLVGLNQPVPEIFRDMRWSHCEVLAQTLVKLSALNIETRHLPMWFDVDTPADLKRLRGLDDAAAVRVKSTLNLLRSWGDPWPG
jgi:uncharacterized protein